MRAILRHSRTAPAALLSLALLLAPLPFAAVTPGARTALALAALAIFLLAVLLAHEPQRLRRVAVPAAALVGLAAVGGLQRLRWPDVLARLVSPEHARLMAKAREALAGQPGAEIAAGTPLTLTPDHTTNVSLWLLAVAAALGAGCLAGAHRVQRRLMIGAVLAVTLFELLYGGRLWIAGSREIWGADVPGLYMRLRGTFVNPNHLASYLTLALAISFAWAWSAWQRGRRTHNLERILLLMIPPLSLWLFVFIGLSFTASRAGLAAGATATLAGGILIAFGEGRRRIAPVGAMALILAFGLVASFGVERGLGRLLGTSPLDALLSARFRVYAETLRLWLRYPLSGSGLGSFEEAFVTQQPADLHGRWTHAHNDFVELLATAGLIGLVLAIIGTLALLRRLAIVFDRGVRTEDRAAGLAGLYALTALAVHELLDFGLTMPATAFTAAVLFGAAASAPTTQAPDSASERGSTEPPSWRTRLRRWLPGGTSMSISTSTVEVITTRRSSSPSRRTSTADG